MRMRWCIFLGIVCLSVNAFSNTKEAPSLDWTIQSQPPFFVGDSIAIQAFLPSSGQIEKIEIQTLDKKPLPELDPQNHPGVILDRVQYTPPSEITSHWIAVGAGEAKIESLFVLNEKSEILARTNPFSVTISSALKEDKKQAGFIFALPLDLPYWISQSIKILFGILVISSFIALVFFIVSLFKRKKKKNYTPEELARESLTELLKKDFSDPQIAKSVSFKASSTLKTYLGMTYHFNATECTTPELFEKLSLLSEETASLKHLFEALDQMKFTDTTFNPDQIQQLLNKSISVIPQSRGRKK